MPQSRSPGQHVVREGILGRYFGPHLTFTIVYIPLILRYGWLSSRPDFIKSDIARARQASHLKSASKRNCSKDTVLTFRIRYLRPPALYPIPRSCVLIRMIPKFTVYGHAAMLTTPINALFSNAWQISDRQILLQMAPATAGPTTLISTPT